MYTKCPECNTVFRVMPEDLKLAQGYVRCGNCQTAFYGLHTLSDSPLPASFGPSPVEPPERASDAPPAELVAVGQQGDIEVGLPPEPAPEEASGVEPGPSQPTAMEPAMDAEFLEAEIASALAEEVVATGAPPDDQVPTLPAAAEVEQPAPPADPAPETFPDLSAVACEAFGDLADAAPPRAAAVATSASASVDTAIPPAVTAADVGPDIPAPEDEAGSVAAGATLSEDEGRPPPEFTIYPPLEGPELPAPPATESTTRESSAPEPADVQGDEAEVVPETVVFPEFHGSTGPGEETPEAGLEADFPQPLELQGSVETIPETPAQITADTAAGPGAEPRIPIDGPEPGEWLRTFLGEEAAAVATAPSEARVAGDDADTETDVFTPAPAPEPERWEDATVIGLDAEALAANTDVGGPGEQPEPETAPEPAAAIDTQPASTDNEPRLAPPAEEDPVEEDEVAIDLSLVDLSLIDLTMGLEAQAGEAAEDGTPEAEDPYGSPLPPDSSDPGKPGIPAPAEPPELALLATGDNPRADPALGTSTDTLAQELVAAWEESWDAEVGVLSDREAPEEQASEVMATAPGDADLAPETTAALPTDGDEAPAPPSLPFDAHMPPAEDLEATAEVVVLEAPDTSATGRFKPDDIEIADETLADFLGLELRTEEALDADAEDQWPAEESGEREAPENDESEPPEEQADAEEQPTASLEFDLAEVEWAQVFAGSAEGDTGTADSPAAETPAPSPLTPPAADLVAETPRRRISTTLWGTAAVVLVLIMAVQLVHFSRQDLVVHPTFGPWVRNVYSAMGMDVNPVWDLAQYQIRKRVTTSIDELGQMPITTTIQNTAPFAQPYPLVRLILWDRWGDTVDTLMFDPEQYLQPAPSAGELLEPYQPVEAAISVVRPDAEEITGFDLDVCLRTERGLVQCARDLGG